MFYYIFSTTYKKLETYFALLYFENFDQCDLTRNISFMFFERRLQRRRKVWKYEGASNKNSSVEEPRLLFEMNQTKVISIFQ